MKSVAVIGAGAAGLSAAWRLQRSGAHITVYEASGVVGGRARSELLDGCIVDAGAQLFASGFTRLLALARECGATDLIVTARGRDAVWRGGRAHVITYGSVSSMISSSALPARLKLRLASRYVPFLMRHARQLDASDLAATGGAAFDNVSVAEWGQGELGSDFIELLAYPLLGAYYGSTPEDTSAALYHALARAGLDVTLFAVPGGIMALFDAFAGALEAGGARVLRSHDVESVRFDDANVRVRANGEETSYDAAVLAVPQSVATRLANLGAAAEHWLSAVRFAPSAVLALALGGRVKADYFGLSLPRTESRTPDLVAICVAGQKTPGLVPEGRSLLVCLGAPGANAELIAEPEAGSQRMLTVVEAVFPGIRREVTHAKLYRHHDGYPVFYPGYVKHLQTFGDLSLPARIALAGDYLVAPNVEGAVRSGERAAARLASVLEP